MTIEKVLEKYMEAEKIRPAFERVALFSWNDMLLLKSEIEKARVLLSTRVEASRLDSAMDDIEETHSTFNLGQRVRKTKGSQWQGRIVGWYTTELTKEGYAVESEREKGSVQIYPASALEKIDDV